jgi:glutamyl-tRNA reductase
MNPEPQLFLIGMSWRTAPVDVRGRYVVSRAELEARLEALGRIEGVSERFVLSTCNRTEVLVAAPPDERLEGVLEALVFAGADPQHLYVHRGVRAVIHLFRVAAGLDSLVIGEAEILGQVKAAMALANEKKCLGKLLDPLLRQALSVGKRVRSDTQLGEGTLSVARVAVGIAAHVYSSFAEVRALVIGAGDTAALVGRHLVSTPIGSLVFANRTLEHAQTLASALGAKALPIDRVAELVQQSDVVFACLEGAPDIVRAAALDRRALRKRDKPLLVVDLSVPRAVEARVAELDNVLYYDLDDVRRVVEKNEQERRRISQETSDILVSEVHKFVSLRTYAAFSPVISELQRRFKEVSDEVLDEVAGATTSPEMMRLAHELSRRLLDVSLVQLKEGARHASPADALGHEYRRFLEGQ